MPIFPSPRWKSTAGFDLAPLRVARDVL